MPKENSILENVKHFINSHEEFKLSELKEVIGCCTIKEMIQFTNMLKETGIIEVVHKDSFKVIANMDIVDFNIDEDTLISDSNKNNKR